MIHLGDITKISGYTAPIVDVVVGGSPCQDLSVAGKRAGLDGERSGLFMEQLRIIKEMRERDRRNGANVDIRPRYMVWENVPGAFSSNKAEDFRIVLEETAKVCDKDAVIPMPNNGKWTTSGCILGDGWSIAWRVCDAQFYGVPQRRRRIALIADFGGHSAPEILFVRKSVSRDTEQSQSQRKETPSDASRSTGADDSQCICFEPGAAKRLGGYVWEDLAPTLRTEVGDNRPSVAYTMQDREGKAGGGKGALIAEELSATLRAGFAQTLFQPVQCIDQGGGKSACNVQEGQAPTLTCTHGGEPAVCYSVENHPADSRVDIDESGNVPMVMECFSKSKRAQSDTDYETWKESDVANTLNAFDVGDKRTTECVVALDRASFNQGKNALYDFEVSDKGVNSPLVAKGPSAVAYTIDEKCANTYVWKEQANTLAARDYKQPQTVVAAVDCRNCTENSDTNGTLQSHMSGGSSLNLNNVVRVKYIVRRLTPLECERLQGYPSELKLDVSKMTKDEYIAYNILEGNIIVDTESGKVYKTRGPGGVKLDKPQEMKGSDSNGYLVVKISNGTTKMTCRVHRIIWISQYGVIPDGYCIDHINSNKKDNRISNLQLLTHQENSTKAAEDGLYLTGEDNHATKISPDLYDEIAYLHHCEGKTMRQLAEIYGISKSRIQQIVKEVGWTDIGEWVDSKGKVHKTSDAARYKALGNSIALPPWKWILKRLCACYERDATLGSLFDGIGGFPLIWEQINGKGSCLWASEIEEFPIAVTKKRIGE